MFTARKLLIAIVIVGLVTEEVAGHKLLLAKIHWGKKLARAKLALIRPLVHGLIFKKMVAAKVIGAKALIGAKLGLGAMAIKHVIGGGVASAGKKKQTTAFSKTGVVRSASPVTPVTSAVRSAITFPEINVPVRFSIGGAQPPIRTESPRQAAKF